VTDNYLLTVMVNAIAGIPLGGALRPYATGGVGLIRTDVNQSRVTAVNALTNNDIGYNIGGGLMAYFSQHVGLRFDFRHLRSFEDFEVGPEFDNLGLDTRKLNYWRTSIGASFRF
jgi:opacity protein-like surface antigen